MSSFGKTGDVCSLCWHVLLSWITAWKVLLVATSWYFHFSFLSWFWNEDRNEKWKLCHFIQGNKRGVLISSPEPSHFQVKTDTRPVLFTSELKFSSKLVFSCLFLAVASYFWVLLNAMKTDTPPFPLHLLLLLWLRKIHNLTRNWA